MKAELIAPMTESEARAAVEEIRRHLDGARPLILDLYEREGWKALGYASWRECVMSEFGFSQPHLYRQLQAAKVEREISPNGEIGSIPEGRLRPLARLPEGERKGAWEEAVAQAPNGKPTGQHVERVVGRKLGTAPTWRASDDLPDFGEPPAAVAAPPVPSEPPPKPTGQSRVNGVLRPDPPHIAERRAAGIIAPDVVPDVTEPEPAQAELPAPEPEPAEPTDEEWLAGLPARERLSARCRKVFDADALVYRRLEAHRKAFHFHAARIAKGPGEYARRVLRFLKTDHPKHWLVCPAPEHGGCGGTGEVTLIGSCPKCYGKGYWIK